MTGFGTGDVDSQDARQGNEPASQQGMMKNMRGPFAKYISSEELHLKHDQAQICNSSRA